MTQEERERETERDGGTKWWLSSAVAPFAHARAETTLISALQAATCCTRWSRRSSRGLKKEETGEEVEEEEGGLGGIECPLAVQWGVRGQTGTNQH